MLMSVSHRLFSAVSRCLSSIVSVFFIMASILPEAPLLSGLEIISSAAQGRVPGGPHGGVEG